MMLLLFRAMTAMTFVVGCSSFAYYYMTWIFGLIGDGDKKR